MVRKHLFPVLVSLLLLLNTVAMVVITDTNISNPVIAYDRIETGTYIDLDNVTVTDNGTHLIIKAIWNKPFPSGTPVSYDIGRYLGFRLDLDNNRKTGSGAGTPCDGYEVSIGSWYRRYEWGNWTDLWINYYASNGTWLGYEWRGEWVIGDDYSMTLMIPLDKLNVTSGSTIMIQGIEGNTYGDDYPIDNYFPNYTVPYADIVVDGEPSDWPDNALLAVDGDDGILNPYQEFNLTAIYIATDNKHLFVRFDLAEEINTTKYNGLDYWHELSFRVDIDNDGTIDYEIYMTPWSVGIHNMSSGSWNWYNNNTVYYNITFYNTKNVEAALNLSLIGIEDGLAGKNITIKDPRYWFHIRDHLYRIYAPYGVWPWSTRIIYTVGKGGYVAYVVDYRSVGWGPGLMNIVIGNSIITINDTDYIYTAIATYDDEPTGNASIDGIGYYYALYIDNTNNVVWPITIAVNYSGYDLEALGVSEDSLGIYYYNASAGEYMRCSNTWIDKDNKIVYANITMDEYLAGDEAVFVLSGQPMKVGGEITVPNPQEHTDTDTLTITTATLTTIVLTTTITILTKTHKKQ